MMHRQDRRCLSCLVICLIKDLNMKHMSERIHKLERNKTLYFLTSISTSDISLVCIKSPLLSVQSSDKLRRSGSQESPQLRGKIKSKYNLNLRIALTDIQANLFNFCFSISTKQGLRAPICLYSQIATPTLTHTHTPSTPPTHPEIVFLLGHLSRVGSCRCC